MSVVLIYRCRLCEDIIEEPVEGATLDELRGGLTCSTGGRVATHECPVIEGTRSLGVTDLIGASETIEEKKKP